MLRVLAHHGIQKEEISDGDEAGRKRKAAMSQVKTKSEEPIQGKIDRDGREADEHRQMAFVERVKRRREHSVRGISGETDCIKTKRGSGLDRGCLREAAVLVNQVNDRFSQNDKPNRSGNRKQQNESNRVRERRAKFACVANRRAARNQRQRYRRDRHSENSQRQLHQTKGNV